MREPCPLLLPKADSYWRGSNLHCGPAKTIDFDVDQSAIYSHDSSGFPVTERAEGLAASKFPERSHHEYVAQRSGRTKWLPALFLPRLASDPPGEDLERRLCLDIQAWPNTSNRAHVASEDPEHWPPWLNCPRCRQSRRPAVSRLDARERLGVGTKRSRSERRGVYQAGPIAAGHAHRNSARGASANPQGVVSSCHEWSQTLASLARRASIGLQSNRSGLPGLSHRPSHVAGENCAAKSLSSHVRFGSKADICAAKCHVRFASESGHVRCTSRCPLSANSGHFLIPADRLSVGPLQALRGLRVGETRPIP